MTALRVVVDQMAAGAPGALGRYTEDLTRQLIATAPRDCEVEGIVSASSKEKYELIEAALPGLSALYKTTLPRRELAATWQLGISGFSGGGMIHSPGLLAPLRRHNRTVDGTQIAVTVHDVLAWVHPISLSTTSVAWQKAMMRRIRKHADAVVVPSHAVATQLAEIVDLGQRVRVIPGAARSGLRIPQDPALVAERVAALGLPEQYILTMGSLEPRKGVTTLIQGLGLSTAPEIPLIVLGSPTWGEVELAAVADEAGLAEGRVRALEGLSDSDLAIVLSRASVFVFPSFYEGFAAPVVEAFSLGVPVVHSDAPAIVEVASDAGVVVKRGGDNRGYAERLITAIDAVLTDEDHAAELRVRGLDRSRAFNWRDTAELVWQLHADL